MDLAEGHVRHEDVHCEHCSISQGQSSTSAQHSKSSSHALCYRWMRDESSRVHLDGISFTVPLLCVCVLISVFVLTNCEPGSKTWAVHQDACKLLYFGMACSYLCFAWIANPFTIPSSNPFSHWLKSHRRQGLAYISVFFFFLHFLSPFQLLTPLFFCFFHINPLSSLSIPVTFSISSFHFLLFTPFCVFTLSSPWWLNDREWRLATLQPPGRLWERAHSF